MADFADTEAVVLGINKIEMNSKKLGIIAAGSAYVYAREAMGENVRRINTSRGHCPSIIARMLPLYEPSFRKADGFVNRYCHNTI